MAKRNLELTDVESSRTPSPTWIAASLPPLEVKRKQEEGTLTIVDGGSSLPIPPYSHSHSVVLSQPPLPSNTSTSEVDGGLAPCRLAQNYSEDSIPTQLPEYPPPSLFNESSEGRGDVLPPYGIHSPPLYSKAPVIDDTKEPRTLAMYFFAFGFIFPLFWFFGALMLVTPLRSPNPLKRDAQPASVAGAWVPKVSTGAWCEENLHTEKEKEAFLARMRSVELKWAKRCFVSLTVLFAFGLVMGITVVVVSKLSG